MDVPTHLLLSGTTHYDDLLCLIKKRKKRSAARIIFRLKLFEHLLCSVVVDQQESKYGRPSLEGGGNG